MSLTSCVLLNLVKGIKASVYQVAAYVNVIVKTKDEFRKSLRRKLIILMRWSSDSCIHVSTILIELSGFSTKKVAGQHAMILLLQRQFYIA